MCKIQSFWNPISPTSQLSGTLKHSQTHNAIIFSTFCPISVTMAQVCRRVITPAD